jgi:putative peptidoglycan lipid II flippase
LAEPIVRLVYERGAFGPHETELATRAVLGYALGIPFYAGVKVASASFHARGDTRTPMRASLLGIAVNLLVALAGVGALGLLALPLATALGTATTYGLLRRLDVLRHGRGAIPGGGHHAKVLLLSAGMGGLAWLLARALLGRGGPWGAGLGLLGGTLGVCVGSASLYLLAAHAVKIEEVGRLVRALRERRGG